jgi:6-pyruvoyl-tetrahydropterin synthase
LYSRGYPLVIMTNIDQLGEDVAAKIKSAERDKTTIAPDLRKVWAAFDAKQEVNGVRKKKDWAKKFGVSLRYCQYLVRDGSRKNQRANSVRVVTLKEGMVVNFDGVKYVIERASLHKTTTSLILKPVEEKEQPITHARHKGYSKRIKLAVKRASRRTFAERATIRTQTVDGFFAYYDPKRDEKGEKPWVLVVEGATETPLAYRSTREDAEELVKEKAESASYARFHAQDKITEYDKFVEQEQHPAAKALAAAVDAATPKVSCDSTDDATPSGQLETLNKMK